MPTYVMSTHGDINVNSGVEYYVCSHIDKFYN
jgi:hypothetical protein